MRTTRRTRPARRRDAVAEPFAAAPLFVAREILQAMAADPVLRRLLDAGKPALSVEDVAESRDRSVANDRMRLAEHQAQVRADALERRYQLLASVNGVLEVSPQALAEGASDVLSRIGCLLVPALADYLRVDLLSDDGVLEMGAVVHNGPARAGGWMPDGAPELAERVARLGTAVIAGGDVLPAGFGAFAGLPLRTRGRTLGVMTLGTTAAFRVLDADDLRVAEDVARALAVALDNARLFQEAHAEARCREQALAAVSHEMRSPLQVISISSAALLRAWPADPSLQLERRQIALIAEQADRVRRLAADLLDLSRVDAGHFSVSPEPVRVGALLHSASEVYRPLAEQKGITLAVSPFPALSAMIDEQRVHQVFANLIANAVRYTPAGGTITLSAQAEDGMVRFSVADSGTGIAPENLGRVFDRFWTGGKCRGCAGLGLAISRAIVQAHGGAMSVQSQSGQGTTFTFTLPLAGA